MKPKDYRWNVSEPCSNQAFPSCKWRTEDLTFFLGHYLGSTFEWENIKTDIYFGTINTSNPDYVRTALRDEQVAKYIKGILYRQALIGWKHRRIRIC